MGMDQYTKITAYIKVEKYPEVERINTKKIQGCSNPDCQDSSKSLTGSFCSTCGSKIEPKEIVTKTIHEMSPWSVNEEYGDEDIFYPSHDDSHFLLPNRKLKHYLSIDERSYGSYEVPNSEDAINELKTNYSDYLDFLTKKGINFTVKFGLITYWA
jgi:hypothetical protein